MTAIFSILVNYLLFRLLFMSIMQLAVLMCLLLITGWAVDLTCYINHQL